jgi:hypothetical protein
MAVCTADVLTADARCLVQAMSDRQLLAAILCVLATANSMACDPATLVASSKCLWESMNERQLLASIALTLCEGGGGGGGTVWTYWEAAHVDDNPPTDPTKAVTRKFLNGDTPVTWEPDDLAWF